MALMGQGDVGLDLGLHRVEGRAMDEGVGKVIAALKETGQEENTLILFRRLPRGLTITPILGRQAKTQPDLPMLGKKGASAT